MSAIDASMFELFREEVKTHTDTLGAGLVAVESRPGDPALLEELMRAAHSIKGAARIVNIDTAVRLAHVMEDALVAAQHGQIRLTSANIDVLLRGSDILAGLALLAPDTVTTWEAENTAAVTALEPLLVAIAKGLPEEPTPPSPLPEGKGEENNPSPTPPLNGEGLKTTDASAPPSFAAGPREAPLTGPAHEEAKGVGGVGSSPFPPVPMFEPVTIPTEPIALQADHSMFDLFREEAREYLQAIANAVPHLSTDPTAAESILESLKQLRGAARLVKCASIADTASAVSEFIRASREAKKTFSPPALEWTRYALATLAGVLATDNDTFPEWVETSHPALATIADTFKHAAKEQSRPTPPPPALKGRGKRRRTPPQPLP